jgi:adenylate cyclase
VTDHERTDGADLDPETRELAAGLERLGVPGDRVRRAVQGGRLEDAIFDEVLDPARSERTMSAREVEARGGLTVAETREMMRAYGLPAPDPDEPFLSPEEADAFTELGQLHELWPPDVRQEVTRVYGRALTRIAQTEVHLFRSRAAIRQALVHLLPLIDPLLVGFHRRKLEQELTQAAVWEVESEAEGLLPGSREVSLLFLDLAGFTAYSNVHGDAAAIDLIERFADTVDRHRGEHGRFVKRLGDGYMLAYPDPREAVDAAMDIAVTLQGSGGIAVHAGLHLGVAVFRDGDYFGRAVNLAARLLGLAQPSELLATEDVVTAADDYPWQHRGPRSLRGFSEPLEIYALHLTAR